MWRQGSWSRGVPEHHHLLHPTLQGLHLGDQQGVNVQHQQELRKAIKIVRIVFKLFFAMN